MAQQIGAVNTLVRGPDGKLKAYNTDSSAAIDAIEAVLAENPLCNEDACSIDMWDDPPPETDAVSPLDSRPLEGMRVVVVGAGGSGKALAFGAAARGAHVIVANRSVHWP